MKYESVIAYFSDPAEPGSVQQRVADVLGVTKQAVSAWGKKGVVPYHSATRLHQITNGALDLDPQHYAKGGRIVTHERLSA